MEFGCQQSECTCLCLHIISEDLAIQVKQVIRHGFVCPLMYDWGHRIKASASITSLTAAFTGFRTSELGSEAVVTCMQGMETRKVHPADGYLPSVA